MPTYPKHLTRAFRCSVVAALLLATGAAPAQTAAPSGSAPASARSPAPAPGTPASATTPRTDGNVYEAGGTVRPKGPIDGDFSAAGGRIVLDQPVGGDALLVGGSIEVRAPVGDDLRALGGDVRVDSRVAGDLFASGGNIVVGRDGSVAGAVRIYGGRVVIDGRLEKGLHVSARHVRIEGEVRGDVDLQAEEIELGPTARLGGALTYGALSVLRKSDGASVEGPMTRAEQAAEAPGRAREAEPEEATAPSRKERSFLGTVLSFLALLACAALFLLLAPRFGEQASERLRASPALAVFIGLGVLLAAPVLAVLFFLTILGIPLGLAMLLLYPLVVLVGFLIAMQWLARQVPRLFKWPGAVHFRASVGHAALALLLIAVVWRIPVLGPIVVGLATVAGVGAWVLEVHRRWPRPGAPQAA